MTVCICEACGAEVKLRSRFELDGECPECGEAALVAEDAYDDAPRELVCADCGYGVEGGGSGAAGDDPFYAGRLSVDDPCPRCGGTLDPDLPPRSPRDVPEYGVAAAAAAKLRASGRVVDGVLDVEDLARSQGLEVVVGAFAHDGQLVGTRIEVPTADAAVQRFVIAHELGHFHLRHTVAGKQIEREANAFASHLLIPRSELRSLLRNRPTIDALRRHFAVSRQAICYAVDDVRGWSRVAPRG